MDFVERWFGLSPDGGTGMFEVSLLFAFAIVVPGVLVFRRRLIESFQGVWPRSVKPRG
jgi:hypothetical protein